MIDFGKILEALKLAPRYLLAIVLVCGFLLFAPPAVIQAMGLEFLRGLPYRPWIGGAFLLAAVLLVLHPLSYGWNAALKAGREFLEMRKRHRGLGDLSPPEAALLAAYLEKAKITLHLNTEDGVVTSLVAKGILYPGAAIAVSMGGGYYEADVNLQRWAWKYLRAHPEVLGPTALKKTERKKPGER